MTTTSGCDPEHAGIALGTTVGLSVPISLDRYSGQHPLHGEPRRVGHVAHSVAWLLHNPKCCAKNIDRCIRVYISSRNQVLQTPETFQTRKCLEPKSSLRQMRTFKFPYLILSDDASESAQAPSSLNIIAGILQLVYKGWFNSTFGPHFLLSVSSRKQRYQHTPWRVLSCRPPQRGGQGRVPPTTSTYMRSFLES